jgi:hypothetical protein
MFVRDFAHVDRPFDEVAPRFVRVHSSLRPVLAAYRVVCGPVRERRNAVTVPVTWEANDSAGIPALDGDIRVVPFGAAGSHVAVTGLFDGGGDPVDAHHRVESAARGLLHALVQCLEEEDAATTTAQGRGPEMERKPKKCPEISD